MIDSGSPFYALWSTLQKSEQRQFSVDIHPSAHKALRKMGPEVQKRVKSILGRVHGSPADELNPHVRPLADHEHMAVGLDPKAKNGYLLKDYRTRLIAVRDGDRLTVHHVETRESGSHTRNRR